MCMLWLRSPNMRQQLHSMQEDVVKKIMKFYIPERVDRHIDKVGDSMSDEERVKNALTSFIRWKQDLITCVSITCTT